jgi:hypothetical protein
MGFQCWTAALVFDENVIDTRGYFPGRLSDSVDLFRQ